MHFFQNDNQLMHLFFQRATVRAYFFVLHTTMVRLITHNLLACHVKGCTSNNFPLQFQNVQIELKEADFNPTFLETFLPKLEWKALVDSAKEASKYNSRQES